MSTDAAEPRKRPLSVTWLSIGVLILAVANLLGVYAGITRWPVFSGLELSLPLWLLVVSYGVFGITWLIAAWGLWQLRDRARLAAMLLSVVYEIVILSRQFIFTEAAYDRERLLLTTIQAVLFVALVIFILTRPGVRQAFARNGEPES